MQRKKTHDCETVWGKSLPSKYFVRNKVNICKHLSAKALARSFY